LPSSTPSERDQRRRAQARLVRVRGEHAERDDDRPLAEDPHRLQHGLDADELQGDVRHRRDDPGDRDHQRERAGAEAAADEVGRRHVAVPVRHRPQPRRHEEHHRVDDDRVRDGEEAERADAEQQRGHGDERVRGVEVTADEEPGDPGAEVTAAQTPLVEVVERLRAAPARRDEAEHRDEPERKMKTASSTPLTAAKTVIAGLASSPGTRSRSRAR
jgi:hypothetical protein